jgi:hypothetical protein
MRVDVRATSLEELGQLRITEGYQFLALRIGDCVDRERDPKASLLSLDDPMPAEDGAGHAHGDDLVEVQLGLIESQEAAAIARVLARPWFCNNVLSITA